MAPTSTINYAQLQDFIDNRLDSLDDNELWYQQLSEFQLSGDETVDQLQLLFNAGRALMEYEHANAEELKSLAEKEASDAAERQDKYDEERMALRDEISQLRDQLTTGTGIGALDQQIRALRAEIDSLRDENNQLKQQNRDRDRELADERDKTERQLARISELDRDRNDLINRRFQLEDTINELNRRMSMQQESHTGRKGEFDAIQRKLKDRNDALLKVTAEYQNLAQNNDQLQSDIDRLTASLQDATKEMNITTDKYAQIKEALVVAEHMIDALSAENDQLKADLQAPTDRSLAVYGDMIDVVDRKIEQWKVLLKEKDDQLEQQRSLIDRLREQLVDYRNDTDATSVTMLKRAIDERDRQLDIMKEQYAKATIEMTDTTNLLQTLQHQMRSDGTVSIQQRLIEMNAIVNRERLMRSEAERDRQYIEQTLADRDHTIVELMTKISKFEKGEYGLKEAIQEVVDCKQQLNFRDRQIEQLINKCSQLQVEMDEKTDKSQLTIEKDQQQQQHVALNIVLQNEIDRLEHERIETKLQMRKLAQNLGQRAIALGLTADDYLLVDDFVERLRYARTEAIDMLQKIDTNHKSTSNDQSLSIEQWLKTEFNQITLRNEQLSNEILHMRSVLSNLVSSDTIGKRSIDYNDTSIVNWPQGVVGVTATMITQLNEHLLSVLQELSMKDNQLQQMTTTIETIHSKLSIIKHSHALLYQQFIDERRKWIDEKTSIEQTNKQLTIQFDTQQIIVDEYERLKTTIDQDDNEQKRRLVESSRQMTRLRINETIMIRKYRSLEIDSRHIYKEYERLKQQCQHVESDLKQRLGYIERQKEMKTYEIAMLQKQLVDTVSNDQHNKLQHDYEHVCENYRKLIDNQVTIDTDDTISLYQLRRDKMLIENQLRIEKDKCERYETMMQLNKNNTDDKEQSTMRMTLMEINELNDRQSALTSRAQTDLLQQRNAQLEQTIIKINQLNIDLQKSEKELQNQLILSIPHNQYQSMTKRLNELEQSEHTLQTQVDYQQKMLEIAECQREYIQRLNKVSQIQVEQLKSALTDLQSDSDNHAIIARLHQQLLHLKCNETDSNEQLSIAYKRIRHLQRQLNRIEQRNDRKDNTIESIRTEHIESTRRLTTALNTIRARFAGCVPLQDLEKIYQNISDINKKRQLVQNELNQTIEMNERLQQTLDENRLNGETLKSMMNDLRLDDNERVKNTVELREQLQACRLQTMRLERNVNRLDKMNQQLTEQLVSAEANVEKMEMENVQLRRELEEQRSMSTMVNEQQRTMLTVRDNEFDDEQDLETTIDAELPIAVQLQQSFDYSRSLMGVIRNCKQEIHRLQDDCRQLKAEKEKLQQQSITNEQMFVQLQQQLTPTITEFTNVSSSIDDNLMHELEQTKQMARLAAETYMMQLQQKDDAIAAYKQLIESIHRDKSEMQQMQRQQIEQLQHELQENIANRLAEFRQLAENIGTGNGTAAAEQWVKEIAALQVRIAELEAANEQLLKSIANRDYHRLMIDRQQQTDITDGASSFYDQQQFEDDESTEDDREQKMTKVVTTLPAIRQRLSSSSSSSTSSDIHKIESILTPKPSSTTAGGDGEKKTAIDLKILNDQLRWQISRIRKENTSLKRAMTNIRNDLMNQVDAPTQNGLSELELKSLKMQLDRTHEQINKKTVQLRLANEQIKALNRQTNEFTNQIANQESIIAKLKSISVDKDRQLSNMQNSLDQAKNGGGNGEKSTTIDVVRRKKKLPVVTDYGGMNMTSVPEKPLVYNPDTTVVIGDDTVSRWEERKRLQTINDKLRMTIEQLKQQVQTGNTHSERLQKRCDQLERTILIEQQHRRQQQQQIDEKTAIIESKNTVGQLKSEVDVNNIRQQLVESHQRCMKLTDELTECRLNKRKMQDEMNRLKEEITQLQVQMTSKEDVVITQQRKSRVAWSLPTVNDNASVENDDDDKWRNMQRQLRKAQIENYEINERLNELNRVHDQLKYDYDRLIKIGIERQRRIQTISAAAVLEDKLVAKEKMIQIQEKRIRELEIRLNDASR